jgi:hypothetical protein
VRGFAKASLLWIRPPPLPGLATLSRIPEKPCSQQVSETNTSAAVKDSVAPSIRQETHMAKKGRKRRSRRKNKANHGKRPNAGRK